MVKGRGSPILLAQQLDKRRGGQRALRRKLEALARKGKGIKELRP